MNRITLPRISAAAALLTTALSANAINNLAECVYTGHRPDGYEPNVSYLFNRCGVKLNVDYMDQGNCRNSGCLVSLPPNGQWNSATRVTGRFRFYACQAPQQAVGIATGNPHCF